MNNYTINTYETKREIINFSKKISTGVNKSTSKFVMDMQYGLAKSGSCLMSDISRSLDEDIKLSYTIERLCDNLANMYEDEKDIMWHTHFVFALLRRDGAVYVPSGTDGCGRPASGAKTGGNDG